MLSKSMPEGDSHNVAEFQEGSSRVIPAKAVEFSELEKMCKRAEACDKLVDETVEGLCSFDSFAEEIRNPGYSPEEAKDFFDSVSQRVSLRQAKSKAPPAPSREATPQGPTGKELEAFRRERISDNTREQARDQAAEDAAWAALRAKLDHIPALFNQRAPISTRFEDGRDGARFPESRIIPRSVFAAAPHLAHLQSQATVDPHIAKTWQLRQEFRRQKVTESLIDLGQMQRVKEPISRAMWRLVILDQFVDFEKLYATLYKGYDHQEESKDFVARRPILSESDWMRTFDAWMMAMVTFYPHRKSELLSYRGWILDLFRSLPGAASLVIKFDRDARDRYARTPYRMDDQNELHLLPLLAQLLSPSSSSHRSSLKRGYTHQGGARKRPITICQNWNLGSCNVDPCPSNRRHHKCSECGNRHRAKDHEECLSKLRTRRQRYRTGGGDT